MAKRGFFAELQYQNQLAAKRQAQAERAYARAHAAAVREAEQAQRQADRARAQLARASGAEQKAAEREAKRRHEEARLAEVASLNAQLATTFDELDSVLAATLAVDDFVDLEELRVKAEHPPFEQTELEVPTPPGATIETPPEPVFAEPEAPKGLGGIFGGKKKHAEAIAEAQASFTIVHEAWKAEAASVPARQLALMQARDTTEQQRLAALEAARSAYQRERDARDADAAATNAVLDKLIRGVQAGTDSAIQEFVGIVLGNSVYPELLAVEHEFEFDSELSELALTVLVFSPECMPSEKEYRFVKAKDEITSTKLSKRELKDRYANTIHQVALRTLHEVFEADRAGHIRTIALSVATEATDPATGLPKRTTLVAVAAERSSFMTFDLSHIVPEATLEHLGASISKNPYDLVGVAETRGVRGR